MKWQFGGLRRRSRDVTALASAPSWKPQCFDDDWYLAQCRRGEVTRADARVHYDQIGWKLGLDPCEFFWTNWYLSENPDVAKSSENPLKHYEIFGWKEGRRPSPSFDARWYANNYNINCEKVNPLLHFLEVGLHSGYAPRADIALLEFQRGTGRAGLQQVYIERLACKVSSTGGEAFVEGALLDGRSFMASKKQAPAVVPCLSDIAKSMESRGVRAVAPYLTTFENSVVFPGSTSILVDGVIINDEIASEYKAGYKPVEQKLWNCTWRRSDKLAIRYRVAITPRVPRGIHLFKEHEQNYFHFCTELLSKLYIIEEIGIDSQIPLLIADDLDERMYEAVNLVKCPERRIIKMRRDVPHAVDQLIYLSDISCVSDVYDRVPCGTDTFLPGDVINKLAQSISTKITGDVIPARRLYMPRRATRRSIINEPLLMDDLLLYGFEIVNPQELSFKSQVRLFSAAKLIVGGTGAAFTNLLWCRRGAHAIIMYPDHPFNNRTFWDEVVKARELMVTYIDGPRTGKVQGKYSMHDSYKIDISKVVRSLS